MVWGQNQQSNKQILISLSETHIRLFLVENNSNNLTLISSIQSSYDSLETLQQKAIQWLRSNKCKGLKCRWLLSRKLYKTFNIKPPQVLNAELDDALKWLIKDQIEQPLDDILASHYFPHVPDQEPEKLTVIVTDKALIEMLIEITLDSGLELETISIDELAAINTFATLLKNDKQTTKIIGFIDQDQQGLIYNFYVGYSLAFTRHIKRRFFPINSPAEFSLENDQYQDQQDQFLLETQRTLDYCVSQVFRKPVDSLLLDASKTTNDVLLNALEQLTELPVNRLNITSENDELLAVELTEDKNPTEKKLDNIQLSLAEAGMVFSQNNKQLQSVNFYQKQYRPKPLEFGFKFASGLVAIFLFTFIGYGFIQKNQQELLEQQQIASQKELQKIQSSLQKLQKTTEDKTTTLSIKQKITRKQNQLIASKQLLSKVANKKPRKAVAYSEVLWALSEQKTDSLWLTKILLLPNSISLSGQTTKPKSIPQFISGMAVDKVLRSQFEEFQIERNKIDSRVVDFFMNNGRYQYAN